MKKFQKDMERYIVSCAIEKIEDQKNILESINGRYGKSYIELLLGSDVRYSKKMLAETLELEMATAIEDVITENAVDETVIPYVCYLLYTEVRNNLKRPGNVISRAFETMARTAYESEYANCNYEED